MPRNSNYPWYEIVPIRDLRDMLFKSAETFSGRQAFVYRAGDALKSVSHAEFKDRVFALGAALDELGFKRGGKAAILSEGRWEWGMSYLAVACGGGVNVPIDKDLRVTDIRHMLDESQAEILFASPRYVDMALELRSQLPSIRQVVFIGDGKAPGETLSGAELIDRGAALLRSGKSDFAVRPLDAEQTVAIVYTSGTMGSAKGVVLSHRNLVSNMMDMCKAVYIDENDTFLSVLPLQHTYECTCGLLTPIYRGCSISYCDSYRRIAEQMQEVGATVMLGVPLLFQTIHRKLLQGIKDKGERKFKIGKALAAVGALFVGTRARRAVFSAVHSKFGGRLRLLISGGAAGDPEVPVLFRTLGIDFIQGYGLTECSPILAVNRPEFFRDDAAGYPLPSVEIRIAEDGEICARGPNVMSGYYQKPEATAEVLRDGWFHTGDLGYLDENGFLHIHGRKKAVIVLTNGKNVYAEEVEACLNHSPFVLESLAWEGPDAPAGKVEEVHATIVPNREEFDRYCKERGVELTDQLVDEVLRKEIKERCSSLPHYKRVRKFTIRWEEFEKTTTRKIKRYLYTEKPKKVPAEQA